MITTPISNQDLESLKAEIIQTVSDAVSKSNVLNEVLKTSDVKKYLKCGVSKIERLRTSNLLPCTSLDGIYYYKLSDVRKMVGIES